MSAVKNNQFTDALYHELWRHHKEDSLEDLIKWCSDMIDTHCVSSNLKKAEFKRAFQACGDRNKVVTKMTNIYMSGDGFKVYQPKQRLNY